MAAHVVVIDTTFRRSTIKVTPAKYMTDVLDEACNKLNLKSSNYGLKNNNKPVDLSRTFRQTGLSSGAKLELVLSSKSPSVVSVALQVPESVAVSGGRLVDKFPSDTTLWLILRKFESTGGTNLNFTARGVTEIDNGASGAGRVFYEMPALNVMGRELSTFGDLQKTLAQLGLNGGNVLIKLSFKKTAQPLEESMAEIGQYFKEEAAADSGAASSTATPSAGLQGVTEAIASLPSVEPSGGEDVNMNTQGPSEVTPLNSEVIGDGQVPVTPSKRAAPVTPEEVILGPNQRPIAIYSAPSSDTPKAALQPHNDRDYEPTIAHAKLHQSRLQNNALNKRLLSDAETEQLEKEKAEKLLGMKEVSIKIRFPDQSSIISPFTADETAAQLYKYVSDVMTAGDQPFKLVWTSKGPQTVPRDDKKLLIRDLGFEGRMLVNFVWEDGASESARRTTILKPQFAQSAKEVEVPEVAAADTIEEEGPSTFDKGKGKEPAAGEGAKGKGGMPKWFKGLGKK